MGGSEEHSGEREKQWARVNYHHVHKLDNNNNNNNNDNIDTD